MTPHRLLDTATEERQLLIAAIEHHAAGHLAQADTLYGRVVRLNRRNPEALHRWALLKQAQGQHRDALNLLDRAIQTAPNHPLTHCHRGYVLQDLGRRREAIASLQRAIRLQPNFVDAHIALGTIHAELDDLANACVSFDKAGELEPRAVEPPLNKAILFEKHGRMDAAIECLDAALRIAPGDPTILHRKAACLRQKGEHTEALRICDAALAARPDLAPAVFEKGLILADSGEPAAAIAAFESAAAAHHLVDACHYNIGNCLMDLGEARAARIAYERAISIRPDYAEAINNLGLALGSLNQPVEALAAFERAVAIRPRYQEALINRADGLLTLDRTAESLAAYDQALALTNSSSDVMNSLGCAYQALGRHDEALAVFDKVLSQDPNNANALNNLGNTLQTLGRYDAALERYAQSIAIKPDTAHARLNAAMCRLRTGDFATGWPLFEWRFDARWRIGHIAIEKRHYREPLWLGDTEPAGRTILVWAEQGYGDTIQFARYAPLLAARGARVIVEVQPTLAPLIEGMAGASAVVASGQALPAFDLHCPIMSLPLACRTTLDTIPAGVPYLRADPPRVASWRQRLAGLPGLKVGLVWSSNPRGPTGRRKSMHLSDLAPLGQAAGITFVSLQKDTPSQEAKVPPAGMTLIDWTTELYDFADTAALIEALDLVISVDTAPAHLAGALGKPIWLLVCNEPCWRWLLGREDSPWYPSMRLFRQLQPGDWPEVVERIRTELDQLMLAQTLVSPDPPSP